MHAYQDDLTILSEKHKTDKWGSHWYSKHYHTHFQRFRTFKINVLEIGVGGYEDPSLGGASLRVWEEYFPFATIYGLDMYDKSPHDTARIKTVKGDQTDIASITKLSNDCGGFDIIIDDGSHLRQHVISSFKGLFPILHDGGVYAIEDLQTSYWPNWHGGPGEQTSMDFLKSLTDGINFKEKVQPGYKPTYFDQNITAMHFYHSLVIVNKGSNSEESTLVKNNMPSASTGGL